MTDVEVPHLKSANSMANVIKDVETSFNESNPMMKKTQGGGRREMGVKVKVIVDFVDDLNEEIHLDVIMSLHFADTAADKHITGKPGFVVVVPEDSDIVAPNVEILNTRSCEHREGFKYLVNTETGLVFVYRMYRIVLKEKLELDRFPFDRQIFKLKLKCYSALLTNWTVPLSGMPMGVKNDSIWSAHDVVVEYDRNLWEIGWIKSTSDASANPSLYKVSFGMSRMASFFMTNFVLITFFVVGSSISCVAVDHSDFASRSGITFTLMLTMVAFKFVMSAYIPKINYLTLLDYYNILGMFLIVTVCVENFIVSFISDENEEAAENIDHTFASIYIIFWIGLHIIIVLGDRLNLFQMDWKSVELYDSQNSVAQVVFGDMEL